MTITGSSEHCGADAKALLASLREGPSSENYWIAEAMVRNCQGCEADVRCLASERGLEPRGERLQPTQGKTPPGEGTPHQLCQISEAVGGPSCERCATVELRIDGAWYRLCDACEYGVKKAAMVV